VFPATSIQLGRSLAVANFLVVVTDRHVLLLACGWSRWDEPSSVWARYPRSIRLGPVDTSPGPTIEIGDVVLEVDDEYVPVVNTADAEISPADFLPPDPLPDL
jgi:hypothetical protein